MGGGGFLVGFYFFSVLHIHLRGQVRLPLRRQLFDHSSFMAPINLFLHLFSRVAGTPDDDRCFIEVDGQRYSWRDGQGVFFDETHIHWAVKGSQSDGIIILFCDIERPMRYRWIQGTARPPSGTPAPESHCARALSASRCRATRR